MTNQELKIKLWDLLMKREVYTQKVSNIQLRTRCPWCGDSHKNQHTGHLYIRINPNDNQPIVYNCFKCPASGILKSTDLEMLGIDSNEFKDDLSVLNRGASMNSYNETRELFFSYKIPPLTKYNPKLLYIEERLGIKLKRGDIEKFKIITSLKDFMKLNDMKKTTCAPDFALRLEDHYVGFLSYNRAFILFRDITEKEELSWYKYRISDVSNGQKCFYTIPSETDLLNPTLITINLSEGIFDCLGVHYHVMDLQENQVNIAICGKKMYRSMIQYLIKLGFVGSHVTVNIFSDDDHTIDTNINWYKKTFKYTKYLFGEFNVYYNTTAKDCGVRKDQILLQSYRI